MEPRKMSPRGQMLWETSMFRAVDEEDEDTILETLLEWEILSGRPVDADPTSVDFQVVGAGSDHGLDLEGALEEKGEEREEESAEEGQSEHGRVDEKDDDGEQEPGETEEEPSSQEPQSQSNQDTTNCTTLPSSTSTTSLWTQLNAERRAKALARARERYGDTLDKPLHVFELNGDEHLLTHLREWHTVWDLKRCMMRKLDAYVTKPVICRGNYIYDDRDYLADVQRDKTDRQAERRRSVVLAGGSRSEGSSGASAGQGQGPQASRPSAPAGPAARSEGSSTGAISSLSSTQQQQEPSASSTSQTPTERNSSYSNNVEDLSPSEDDEDDQDLYYVAGRRFHPAFPDMEVHVDLQQLQLQREKVMQGRARRSSCRGKSASYSIFNPLN
ncbi:unnamed protein product [Amoebophrya sp. A25]|nr:unnamed protein product [Amoebophrya sp. A25]|eukprot:GSA25T00003176001.1